MATIKPLHDRVVVERVEAEEKAGDRVLFGKYSGQAVKLDGKEVLVMREDDILAIVA